MGTRHGVVLGGGLSGMLTASVLARHFDVVTVVERDRVPDGPGPRAGVPQARHAHLLLAGGARAVEELLPGTLRRLVDAGAHRVGIPNDLVSFTAQGWLPRYPEMQFMMGCSRGLLDWAVRAQTLRNNRTSVRQRTEALGLVGDRDRVRGVVVRDRDSREETHLPADLVVDATGRGSRMRRWVAGLGLPEVVEETVDSGLAYATRVFRARAARFPVVNVQADPRAGRPGRAAILLPIEQGRWLATVSGTRGGEPTTEEDDFVAFARSARHPVVGDLIADAEPLTPVYGSHSTANRRLYFERLPSWPEGLLVLGDAVASFNPVYGHGMSVAALSAVVLDAQLGQGVSARRAQRAIARTVDGAWLMATNQDILFPDAIGRPLPPTARLVQRYVDRLARTATSQRSAARALLDAFTLSGPMTGLAAPRALIATLRGPRRPALEQPPLTPDELGVTTG